jgi:hypothetical protein
MSTELMNNIIQDHKNKIEQYSQLIQMYSKLMQSEELFVKNLLCISLTLQATKYKFIDCDDHVERIHKRRQRFGDLSKIHKQAILEKYRKIPTKREWSMMNHEEKLDSSLPCGEQQGNNKQIFKICSDRFKELLDCELELYAGQFDGSFF